MSSFAFPVSTDVWWSTRRSRVLLAVVQVPFALVAPISTALGVDGPRRSPWLPTVLAIGIFALQLRHSFAAARGMVPARWPLTLAALGLLVFAPLPWFELNWGSIQWFFIASAAMLLTGWPRLLSIVIPIIGTAIWGALDTIINFHTSLGPGLYFALFWGASLVGAALCIYGATALVRTIDDLFTTRAELAESTVGQERLRVSRDLHDLLGQSLSAVSLKGDLALALLRGGSRSEAEEEIRGLTEVAREALHDIRHVVRDEHPVSLHREISGAEILLSAASIEAKIDLKVDADSLPRPVDELLGWATREGVANVLRHSQASSCSIRLTRSDGSLILEIVNDGAGPASAGGSGLAGLAERAQALGGFVTAEHLADGRFRLLVCVPGAIG